MAIVAVLALVVGFVAGRSWPSDPLGSLSTYQVESALSLQAPGGQVGSLPKGSTLYEYRVMPETTTFVLFVNSKYRDRLTTSPVSPGTLSPVEAYVEIERGDKPRE
jgi:hypothetical protein